MRSREQVVLLYIHVMSKQAIPIDPFIPKKSDIKEFIVFCSGQVCSIDKTPSSFNKWPQSRRTFALHYLTLWKIHS